jgi:hypothetical protein
MQKVFLIYHKNISIARSKVFAAMIENEMIESTTNTVDIPEFDAKVVEGMLEYIYTGKVESLPEGAPDLLQIAEKYDLQGLKEECELAIAANLTVETAAELLILSNVFSPIVLKPKVIDFINR